MLENKLIKIASQSKYCGLKTGETFRCKMKNKICGDEIEIMIYEKLNELRYETKACIFTQASLAILAKNFKKIKNFKEIITVISDKIDGKKTNQSLKYVKDYDFFFNKINKNRKECILLPYKAVLKALDD